MNQMFVTYDEHLVIIDDYVSMLEMHLVQAIQELRDAANLCTSNDMPITAENFAKAARRKEAFLENSNV